VKGEGERPRGLFDLFSAFKLALLNLFAALFHHLHLA
jgi:hypothetical protein